MVENNIDYLYICPMEKEKCICGSVETDRIGEVYAPRAGRFVLAYRFSLDCPVHGIRELIDGKWVQKEAPKTKEQKEADRVARNKEIRKERRLKRMALKKKRIE